MGKVIKVNMSFLAQDAGIMRERLERLNKDVGRLYDVMDELNGMWEGVSKSIFLDKLKLDKDCIEELLGEVERVVLHMEKAVDIYRNCENAVSREIDEICV